MNKLFDLNGKTALVVGGHGGIGKAMALGLADAGQMLLLLAGTLKHLTKPLKRYKQKGGNRWP